MIEAVESMRKMGGSGNYLKNQVRKNFAKAAFCLSLFFLVLSAVGLAASYTSLSYVYDVALLVVSLVPLGAFYYYLRKYRVYNAGLAGEKQVVKLLSSKLSDDYFLLNDLHLRGGGGDVDHIILGPNGVFVLETKNWNGDITCHGNEWQRKGKRSFKGSPSLQVKRNAAKVRQIIDSSPFLRELDVWVEGIVVFTNKHATLHLDSPTVPILRLHQLPAHLLLQRNHNSYSQQQLEVIGKEILKRKN
jgi:hypothetical protein